MTTMNCAADVARARRRSRSSAQIRHRGGWIKATLTGGVTAFIRDRIDVPPELLIPLLA